MSVKIDRIRMDKGDTLIIQPEGSVELGISIQVTEQGTLQIYGPMNVHGKDLEVSTFGIKPIEEK